MPDCSSEGENITTEAPSIITIKTHGVNTKKANN